MTNVTLLDKFAIFNCYESEYNNLPLKGINRV